MPPSPSAAESSERMPGTVEVFVGPGLGEPVTVLPRLNPAVFGFMAGGLAACGAVTFTNPMEVVKTRLQLQGEKLIPSGSTRTGAPRLRLGTLSTLTFLFRSEGLAGLQKGLGTAYLYQLCLNGTRLGLYTPTKDFFTRHLTEATAAGEVPRNRTAVNVLSGMVAGIAGACVGSPLYLIKTRMQSYSTAAGVGHQHHYTGTWGALRRILRQDGVRGLFRGMDASMVRTGVGSAVQLSAYDKCKDTLLGLNGGDSWFQDNIYTHSVASLLTGLLVCFVMNPFDVVSTRMYNQKTDPVTGRGSLYRNPAHCLVTTFRSEGISAFYKALVPQYVRLGPHTVLMFVFMEQIKALGQKWDLVG